jgi:acyl dehydratase
VAEQLYGADIEAGDEIGPLLKSPDLEQVKAFLGVWRTEDRNPDVSARFTTGEGRGNIGFNSPIVPGPMSFAFVSQLLTDWAGPLGRIRNLDLNYRRPTRHGEELKCIGLITDTHEEGGETIVKLDVFIEDPRGDRPTQGVAEVTLPTSK